MQTQNEDIHLLDYWRILSKQKHIVITFFAIVVGIVTVYSFTAIPIYEGTAQILVDMEKNTTMTFAEGGGAHLQMEDSAEYYQTQKEILKSRAFADRVVRKLQLDKNAYFLEKKDKIKNNLSSIIVNWIKNTVTNLFPKKANHTNPFSIAIDQQELDTDLINIVLDEMKVEIGKGNNIMKIHYQSANPNVAAVMANGAANAYIEHNLNIRVKPFRDAVEWLSARMVELRVKVEESEKVLQQYKEGKGIVSFESKENVITQKLAELVSQLVQAENKRQETEIRYNQIKSVINTPELLATVPDIMNNLVIQGLRNQELDVKKQISELSEKYGPKHPQMIKVRTELETIQKNLITETRKMLSAANTDYEIAKSRESSIKETIEEQKQEVLDLSRKAIDFNVLSGEAESNKQFYELLLKRLQEASLSSGISISNAQIVDNAVIPEYPIKPNKGLNIFLAVITGLFGGVFVAFFIEYMDNTVKLPDEVDSILNLPCLGFVPSDKNKDSLLYIYSYPKSITAESYRTLRTAIMFSSAEMPPQVILITSSTQKEGKTTTSANLAIAMAQMKERVLLIDADMRQHNIHNIFKLDNTIGLSNILVDHHDHSAAVKTIPGISNLSIITAGTLPPNPSELIGSNRMKELLNDLRQRYDRIIIDSPPVLSLSDSIILSRLVDGVILIIHGGTTGKDVIKRTILSLTSVNAKMLGVVLNNINITNQHYHYYQSYNDEKTKKV